MSATSTKSLSPATRRKGYRGAGSLRERTVARICSTLSAHHHHRFVLSIEQHGSPLVQKTHLPRVTTPNTYGRTDIPVRKWQYQLIYFSLSPILSYYITTRKGNTVKEKGLACSQKGEIAITTTNYSLQSYGEKQGGTCSIFQAIYISLQNTTETFNEMRDIRIEKGINKGNALLLCEWSNEQGKEFQEQWMGSEISYPLDYDKIKDLGNVFSIFNQGEFIGMIQEVRIGKDNIHIGRFVIDPRKTGLGFGTEALKRFVDFILEDDNIKSISLTVFDFNQKAKRIYEKLGFEINEVIETPKLKYIMKRYR